MTEPGGEHAERSNETARRPVRHLPGGSGGFTHLVRGPAAHFDEHSARGRHMNVVNGRTRRNEPKRLVMFRQAELAHSGAGSPDADIKAAPPARADALRSGLRRQAHWLSGSWVSSRMAIGSTMIRRSGSSDSRRPRNKHLGPVMSRYHRRLPLEEPRLPVLSSPRPCLPLCPITSLDLLRILLRRSRLHEGLVKQAMPPHRIAAFRRRT